VPALSLLVCSADCAGRAFGAVGHAGHPWLGGSRAWPDTYVDTYEGSQLFADPHFSNYTIVFAPYCDGGSWTGNHAAPVASPQNSSGHGQPIYYRGKLLLEALFDSVMSAGLADASHLLWSGCSAGGLTTYLHADWVAARVSAGTRVLGLADAMFSLDHQPYIDHHTSPPGTAAPPPGPAPPPTLTFSQQMAWGYRNWNASGGINAGCLAHYGRADGWRCLLGANVARFVLTPLFVLNSKFDTWQAGAIIGAPPPGIITKVPQPVQAFWLRYSQQMVGNFSALPTRHGGLLTNCPAHCQTGRATHGHDPSHRTADPWNLTTVNGTAIGAAFGAWYHARASGSTDGMYRWVAADTVSPTPPDTCGYY
jgi:hypothetical protein